MNNIEFIDGMNKAWDLAFRLIGEDKDVLLKMFGTDEVDEIISNNEPQYVLKKLEGYDNEKRFIDIRNGLVLPLILAWMPLPKPYKEKGE